jgi:DNA invertase Pin-like site-specific DNA recombinase
MTTSNRAQFIPIDQRDPTTVRAVILARSSDPGAKAADMASQVERSRAFIERMGWRLVADPFAYAEAASGMRNVARPVLQDVLKLAVSGQIDVIVASEQERVARSKGRRWQAIQTALDHGVEFRFANLPPDGRLPDDPATRLWGEFSSFMAEAEAEKIVERTWPLKQRRFEDGLPHGGRAGPLYGYGEGERRMGKHNRPAGMLSWTIDEAEAPWVRWLYGEVDRLPAADLSLRGLAGELHRRGAPTATGTGFWSSKQVVNILRQPKYCGRGRNLRYRTQYVQQQDPQTREVAEVTRVHDRMRDAAAYASETFPIPAEAIPPIIDEALWLRVQQKLDEARALHNRGGARRGDDLATSALLDGGYVRCAECGHKMVRYWASRKQYPFYQCRHNGGAPGLPGHATFQVPVPFVDKLAIRLLAKAMTDPQQILALASAAEEKMAEAAIEASLSASALAAYHQRLAQIVAQQDELLRALEALARVSGMERQVSDIRARLAELDRDRAEAEGDRAKAAPQQAQAAAREAFLRQVFTLRGSIINFALGAEESDGDPLLHVGPSMRLDQAALLLGMSEDDVRAAGIPVEQDTVDGVIEPQVATERVVRLLLERLGRDRLRKLLGDLGAVVMVKKGRTRAEYLEQGAVPLSKRVRLQLLGTVVVRADEKNISKFS